MKGIARPPTNLQALADRLKVLAEPQRLLILHTLMEGVQCNCELGGALRLPPNLVSHHLRVLREVGLVDVARDALDARWVYYSVNRQALDELNEAFGLFFDPARIQPRRPTCGPEKYLAEIGERFATPGCKSRSCHTKSRGWACWPALGRSCLGRQPTRPSRLKRTG